MSKEKLTKEEQKELDKLQEEILDEAKKVVQDYGVWALKKFMGREYMGINRTTFIIDQNQLIERIFTKVNTKKHSEQILESYK